MNCSFLFFYAVIVAMVFGAATPNRQAVKSPYPKIVINRYNNPYPGSPWLSKLYVDSIDFGYVPKYDNVLNTQNMKYELIRDEMFGKKKQDCRIEIEKVFVNGKNYGGRIGRTKLEGINILIV